jgi:hypothetical protein
VRFEARPQADLGASEGSSALLAAQASPDVGKDGMGYRCCGMTDYHALTGIEFGAEDVAAASTCSAPAAPSHGSYTGVCATAGATMQSGWQCTLECDGGYTASGTTTCVKGQISEEASCGLSAENTTSGPATTSPVNGAISASLWGRACQLLLLCGLVL